MSIIATQRDALLTTTELAEFLNVPVNTIYKWRATKRGPASAAHRVGRHLRWNAAAVDAWLSDSTTKAAHHG